MPEIGATLTAWNGFYTMIGSSAAALTGLMFVVITLIRDSTQGTTEDGLSAFSTPTVCHFSCVLFTSAVLTAPFRSLVPIAVLLVLAGAGGSIYVVGIARRTSKLERYRPDLEDWCWHVALPLIAYATLAAGGIALHANPSLALFAPAVTVSLLILIGIHNAWDVVTFIAMNKTGTRPETATGGGTPSREDEEPPGRTASA